MGAVLARITRLELVIMFGRGPAGILLLNYPPTILSFPTVKLQIFGKPSVKRVSDLELGQKI